MKPDYTHIAMILDNSGSMLPVAADTVGGFNTFLDDQKAAPGEATLTLAVFNSKYNAVCRFVPLADVKPLGSPGNAYITGGMTALLDAIGYTITDTGNKLAEMPEDERPEKVLVVIITDGEENSSREYTRERVREMIEHQKEKYGWEFVFLGADQDSFAAAGGIGIDATSTQNFVKSADGLRSMYAGASVATVSYRTSTTKKAFFDPGSAPTP